MKVQMIGGRFERLTVMQEAVDRAKSGELKYLCKCDCGEQVIVRGSSLRAGATRSCGCLASEVAAERMKRIHGRRIW